MASKRQRRAAYKTRKQKLIREDEVSPFIAKGLTQGVPAEEALEHFKPVGAPGIELARNLGAEQTYVNRVPTPRFVAAENPDALIEDPNTGRVMHDAVITVTDETFRAMQEGMICLRCLEPQAESFPDCCDLCGYAMRDRQIIDIAMEYEGKKHIGPHKALREFLDDQEIRVEKRQFIRRVLDGGQGRIPKSWLSEATLLDGLTSAERQEIGARVAS
jgi:hypothetical protein